MLFGEVLGFRDIAHIQMYIRVDGHFFVDDAIVRIMLHMINMLIKKVTHTGPSYSFILYI